MNQESSEHSAYLYIIKLLSKRDYSKYKLENKLVSKGYDTEHIKVAIDEVIQKGYLKEKEYATARAKILMDKGIHPELIESKLSEEHIAFTQENIQQLFVEYKISTVEQLNILLKKKLRSIDSYKLETNLDTIKQKLIRYCLSKGHDLEEITSTLEDQILQSQNQL